MRHGSILNGWIKRQEPAKFAMALIAASALLVGVTGAEPDRR